MKNNLILSVIFLWLTLSPSVSSQRTSNTANNCCSTCSQSTILSDTQTPAKLKDLIALAVAKKWTLTNFMTKLQTFPGIYFTSLYDSIVNMNSLVQNGSSSCGGRMPHSSPNDYLPTEIINTLYGTMIDAYKNNPSNLNISYAQAMAGLLTSLQTQFNNNYGIPADASDNNTFISYQNDPTNFTIGVVSSNALASCLAASILNSADPIILAAINYDFFNRTYKAFQNYPIQIEPEDLDISFQMGFNDVKVPLTFNQLQQNRSPPIGLRTFSIYVDELNGDPFGYPVGSRFSQTTITDFSSSNTQSAQLTSNQNSGSSLSVSDSTKAKITGNLLAGYAYCFFPSLITAMQGTCMGSCNRSC